MPIFRSRTPDEELAKAVKDAAKAYNRAVEAAKNAGLTVTCWSRYGYGSLSRDCIGSQIIEPEVTKNVSTRY